MLGSERLSYAALAEAVDGFASGLRDHGVEPGDRVAHLGAPDLAFLISFLAAGEVGAVWLGLNPRYTERELAYVLDDARPRLVLDASKSCDASKALRAVTEKGGWTVIDYPEMTAAGNGPGTALKHDIGAAALVYTSGSTGRPKGALIRHEGLVHAGEVYAAQYPVERAPFVRALCNLPINHVGCLCDVVATAICAEGTIVFMRDFDPEGIVRTVQAEALTHVGQVPTMWRYILEAEGFEAAARTALEWAIWSGAPMPLALAERLKAPGIKLSNCYGMTETTGSVCFTDPAAPTSRITGSIGHPVEPGNLRLAMDGEPIIAPGAAGEVQVRGPWLMEGYFGDPERTDAAMDGEWFRTGDLAEREADGSLRLVGRLKEMFKSGGYNVYPREIEEVIEDHPKVAAAAVLGTPDDVYGEVGTAFVIREGEVTSADLDAWCRERMANYKVPKRIVVEAELPLLPIGKIDKSALRDRLATGVAA